MSDPRVEVEGDQVVLRYGGAKIVFADNEAWDVGDELCLAAEKIWAQKVNAKASQARGEASDA